MPLGNQNICVEPNPKRIQFNKFIPARIKLHVPPDPMWKHLLCNLESVWRSFWQTRSVVGTYASFGKFR